MIISSGPSGVTDHAAPTFEFMPSNRARCSLDGLPWSPCRSPWTTLAVVTGPHVFSVRAKGAGAAHRGWFLRAECDPPFGTWGPGNWPPGCWRPYADSSPFNRPIPLHPRLVSDSRQVVKRLASWGPPSQYAAGEQDTRNDFAHPVYWSRLADPRFTVRCGGCAIDGFRIRIPVKARPAAGSDGHMAVVAQGSHREYDFWRARLDRRRHVITAQGGGRISIDGSGRGSAVTAAHFGNLAGIIRAQELESGEIDHALFMVVHCFSGLTVYPAKGAAHLCSLEHRSNRFAPPLGGRFQLDMSDAEIEALGLPPWKQAIYLAMAHYGMIVGDTGGGPSWSLQFESDSTYTSFGYPPELARFAAGAPGWQEQPNGIFVARVDDPRIDWSRRLRLVAPCVSSATC